MESIVSKKNFKYYKNLIARTLFCFAISTLILLVFINEINIGAFQNRLILMPICTFALVTFAMHNIYIHIIKVPDITISLKYIVVNGAMYDFGSIKSISFIGKKAFGDAYPEKEAAQIIFADNTSFIIYDDYYSNSAELKLFLESVYLNKKLKIIPETKNSSSENFYWVRGGILGPHSISFILIMGLLFIIVNALEFKTLIVCGLFLILISLFIKRFFYFGLSNNYLKIKSYTIPWLSHTYSLKNIKEVIFESGGKAPNGMRIITHSYNNSFFYAATLYDKHWRKLKSSLEKKGIPVRDEIGLN